jgi:hypothetical protein
MERITYDQAEQIISKLLNTANCASIYQDEWLRSYLSELISTFPEVREHIEERIHMLKLYKEKGLL